MQVTNQDVCAFFGFSKNLAICNPGGMNMMLEGLVAKGYQYELAAYSKAGVHCVILREEGRYKYNTKAKTAPLAVLEAVRQLIKEVR